MRSFKLGKAAEEEAAENAKAAGAADVAGIVAANDVVLFVSSSTCIVCPGCFPKGDRETRGRVLADDLSCTGAVDSRKHTHTHLTHQVYIVR